MKEILPGHWFALAAAVEAAVVAVKPWLVPCSVQYFGSSLTADGK